MSATWPPFFVLRSLPGNAWPPLPTPELAHVWAAYLEIQRSQWLAPAEIEERQLLQVRLLLQHCVQHVPYYQEALRGIAVGDIRALADFRRLPILKRATYQERYAEFVARELPNGTVATGKMNTSGTSGVPIEVRQTNVTSIWWLVFHLRDLEWCGMNPRGTLAAIRGEVPPGPGKRIRHWHGTLARLIEMGPAYGMDIHEEPRHQLAWLREVAPDYLITFPSNLEYLASLAQEDGRGIPGLKAIQTFAETLAPETQARIEAAFGVPVKNLYSCTEAGYLASPCPQGHGLHVHAENVILEVLDEAGQPCPAGQPGRVVLTLLHNFITPFIRYEIMDDAVPGGRCPCGRGLPLLLRVEGKRRPLFHLGGGRRKSPVWLVEALRNLGGIRQQQVIQKTIDHVVIRVVPARDWTSSHADQIRSFAEEFFGRPLQVTLEVKDRLDLPPGGKLQEVITEVSA